MPFQPFLCRLWNVKVVDKLFGRLLTRRWLGGMRLLDRLASLLFGLLHLSQPLLYRILCRYLFRRTFLEGGRLGMLYGRRRCSGTWPGIGSDRLVIVPMGAFDMLLILFAEGCH